VLASLIYAIFKAFKGIKAKRPFTKANDSIRHWTATIAHIQLVIGIMLYSQSPLVKYFWRNFSVAVKNPDAAFFGFIHVFLMSTAIVLITIGSALAKRKLTDQEKFRTMFNWFGLALIIILLSIPWPFYPFAARPLLR